MQVTYTEKPEVKIIYFQVDRYLYGYLIHHMIMDHTGVKKVLILSDMSLLKLSVTKKTSAVRLNKKILHEHNFT